MKVRGSQSVEVELDKRELKNIALAYLSERFKLSNSHSYYHKVTDGKLVLVEEHNAGSHSHETETVLRPATPMDEAVLLVMHAIDIHG